jgi:hypothetical protein
MHEILTSMDFVLSCLEEAKGKHTHMNASYFKACVNLGWWKLDQYYSKTDLNPAYIMAVFLHPHYKLRWFRRHWVDSEYNKAIAYSDEQYAIAKAKLGVAAPLPPSRPAPESSDAYDAYNRLSSLTEDDEDDLLRYKTERIAPFSTDAVQWWRDNGHLYPVLKQLAFTYLAAPPSSSDDEGLFSIAGNVVNEERPHTSAELAEAVQCLRSWHENKLI